MGTFSFLLPSDLPAQVVQNLERACIVGGQDNLPFLSEVVTNAGQMRVSRQEDESGSVQVPWTVEGAGTLMTSTATLITRPTPYALVVELARGKVNQLRNQAADWLLGGLNMPPGLAGAIREATLNFGRATACSPSAESAQFAQTSLVQAYASAAALVNAYIDQVFQVRHQRQPRLDTLLGARLFATGVPDPGLTDKLDHTFNTICLPLSWAAVEPAEDEFQWEAHDQLLDWAITSGFHTVGGPLIDCGAGQLPSWLWLWERDLASIASFMCDYVESVVKRYRGRIRTWQLIAASNSNGLLGLGEEEMLWLTVRVAEAARQADPKVELLVGIAQPWGEYLVGQLRNHSPFVFADTLIRSGLNLTALDLEVVMGVSPRGSYCRDLLELSRLIDLYSLLGVPLQITLGLPSAASADPHASSEVAVDAGAWHGGYSPTTQAEWAEVFGRLVLCKPSVRSVIWPHVFDAAPHLFPWCSLIDSAGAPKPALERLARLRAEHLR
jgi:hypothetical protein